MISEELNLPVSQSLALFIKSIHKITNEIKKIYTDEIEKDMNVKVIYIKLGNINGSR